MINDASGYRIFVHDSNAGAKVSSIWLDLTVIY
jgi:hypothetical protein